MLLQASPPPLPVRGHQEFSRVYSGSFSKLNFLPVPLQGAPVPPPGWHYGSSDIIQHASSPGLLSLTLWRLILLE
jgi:hypothetical protein